MLNFAKRFGLIGLLLVMAIAPLSAVHAQDEMTHTCDSSTILLLLLAESEMGFHSMMDTATFEKGQYAPLFDAMMSMMEEEEAMTEEAEMTEEEAAMTEEEAIVEESMMLATIIEGEDEACTALRAELDKHIVSYYEMAMMGEGN